MELFFKCCAICIVSAVLAMFLREQKQMLGFFIIVAAVAVTVPFFAGMVQELFSFFDRLTVLSSLPKRIFEPMLKVVAIAAVTKIGTSLCCEAESETAGALLEMGGTCCALLASLPLMSMVLDLLNDMI